MNAETKRLIKRTLVLQARAKALHEKYVSVRLDTIRALHEHGVSMRDIAAMVDLSHQRVGQILLADR